MVQANAWRVAVRMAIGFSNITIEGMTQRGYLQTQRRLHQCQVIRGEKAVSERAVGTYGSKKIPGVRVTYSNGIYNLEKSCRVAAELISKAHGDVEVTYVHHPSVDFWTDVGRASRFLLIGHCRHAEATAEVLSNLWVKSLQEMQQESGHPRIIHYGHSLGGVIAYLAAQRFSSHQSLDLRLFGSPWLVPPNSFGSVRHIVATEDPVTWLTYFQFRRLMAKGDGKGKGFILEKVPCKLDGEGKTSWRARHHLGGLAYAAAVQTMGEDFVMEQETKAIERLLFS